MLGGNQGWLSLLADIYTHTSRHLLVEHVVTLIAGTAAGLSLSAVTGTTPTCRHQGPPAESARGQTL